GVYRKGDRRLAYGNAGHPPALLFAGPSAAAERLESTGVMIGMLPPGMEFDARTVPVPAGARLLLYSDGVFEVEQPGGAMWSLNEFVDFVSGVPADAGPTADALLAHVRRLHAADTLGDDFSFLEVRF